MKFYQAITVVQFLVLVTAYNPFKGASQAAMNDDELEMTTYLEFNPDELLNSRSRKPEIYTKAMLELKRLEEEPICHRVAVQLLMNNCQGLEDVGEDSYQWDNGHLQRHHVESFAASLAICDLERGRFIIPQSCTLFTSSALHRISRDGRGKLQVSPEQVGGCLEALGQDHSHWNTWLSYRDKALLFCRAARIDIDKDQAIQHHKRLMQIMTEFADDLEKDLKNIREDMTERTRATDLYFDGMKTHLGDLRSDIQHSVREMSNDITNFFAAVKSSLSSTEDLDRMLRSLFQTAVRGTAEMAAEQEQALEITTKNTRYQMVHLNDLAGETGATIAELRESIHQLVPVIMSLNERQNALDQRSEALYATMANITNLLQDHTEHLEQASFTVSYIHSSLEKAATAAGSWNATLMGGSLGNYSLRIGTPLTTLILGNYGLPPSLFRNAALLLGGIGFGEMLVQLRHLNWAWVWSHEPSAATAFTHLPREHDVRSLAAVPVEAALLP